MVGYNAKKTLHRRYVSNVEQLEKMFPIYAYSFFFKQCLLYHCIYMTCMHISDPRDISPSRDNVVSGSHYPGPISIRYNNTRENCILNVQDGVQQKLCFISFLDNFSFWCCSLSIKWISSCILCVFTFGTCNFRHVGFHVPTVRKIII